MSEKEDQMNLNDSFPNLSDELKALGTKHLNRFESKKERLQYLTTIKKLLQIFTEDLNLNMRVALCAHEVVGVMLKDSAKRAIDLFKKEMKK
jgi:hypothetical protein